MNQKQSKTGKFAGLRDKIPYRGPVSLLVSGMVCLGFLGLAVPNFTDASSPASAQSLSDQYSGVRTASGIAPLSFADLVERVRPSVVSINVKNGRNRSVAEDLFKGLPDLPNDHPLNEFFA